jgi:hypothetical protein
MDEVPIPGWGIDRRIEDRPGYPLDQQWRVNHDTLGGVPPHTQTIPLRGLSGRMRQAAYRWPDWRARRWMLLTLADRVDVVESALGPRALLLGGGIVAAAAAALGWFRRR